MTNRIIIHFVDKEQGTQPVPDKSTSILDIEDNVNNLTERLNEAFKKDEKVLRTEFKEDRLAFQLSSRTYIDSLTDEEFLEFASISFDRMVDLLRGNNLATGGYFVYIDYVYRNINYLAVFIVRDAEEIIFDKPENSENFVVNTTTIINTNKLAMAVRIDMRKIREDEPRYLHFTNKQSHQSAYFIDWIEAELADKSSDDSSALIYLINNLHGEDIPINPETNEQFDSEEFRKRLYDNIHSSGRIVRLREISSTFWNNEDFLQNKIEELGLDMSNEFQAVESILKRLKKYEIISGKIKLAFSQNDIDEGRVSIGDNDNQIIIESEQLRRAFDNL